MASPRDPVDGHQNGVHHPIGEHHHLHSEQGHEGVDYQHPSNVDEPGNVASGSKGDSAYQNQLQPKPNKIYIGGLPEHTRQEDLQNCFGKLGPITNIELKVGYGFVEFEDDVAANESVAKYNEGFFMGNKIRVEISHGGGRAAAHNREPGACFRCGQMGHWARECPNHATQRRNEPPLPDRADKVYRDHKDPRYDYPPPRDYRRSPPRDYRDYPPPGRYDDYRRAPSPDRFRGPPPDYRGGYDASYRYGPPPAAPYGGYDRYDRRPAERYPAYPPSPARGMRPRSPPRYRDDYDRAPPRDFDYRGRSPPPPAGRYPPEYRAPPTESGYRRGRSGSPRPAYDYSSAPVAAAPPTGQFADSNGAAPPTANGPRSATRDYPANPPRSGEIYRRS